jgi:hypothetical protein
MSYRKKMFSKAERLITPSKTLSQRASSIIPVWLKCSIGSPLTMHLAEAQNPPKEQRMLKFKFLTYK